jgi:hypothetical protein
MEKSLFAIFPDLPGPRPTSRRVRRLVPSVQRPYPPAGLAARRSIRVNRDTRVWRTARTDDAALRRIRQIAQTHYERLPPGEKKSGIGLVFQKIVDVADAATRSE